MAATESTMLGLGTPAPDFALPDSVSGRTIRLSDFDGKQALLVMFICPHCPYVKHIQQSLSALLAEYRGKPLGVVAISPNDIEQFPEDAPEGLRQSAIDLGFEFPYCYDESQEVAKAYQAACTPDFFLFDGQQRLAYRGQFDSSRPKNQEPVTGADLRAAIDAVLHGKPATAVQRPSIGCNIKWKPGNEPVYYR
jgi:peroxiredoxin